eukprot:SAG22_NODE_5485_length_1006_cov_0.848953_2_plen_196_part_00
MPPVLCFHRHKPCHPRKTDAMPTDASPAPRSPPSPPAGAQRPPEMPEHHTHTPNRRQDGKGIPAPPTTVVAARPTGQPAPAIWGPGGGKPVQPGAPPAPPPGAPPAAKPPLLTPCPRSPYGTGRGGWTTSPVPPSCPPARSITAAAVSTTGRPHWHSQPPAPRTDTSSRWHGRRPRAVLLPLPRRAGGAEPPSLV